MSSARSGIQNQVTKITWICVYWQWTCRHGNENYVAIYTLTEVHPCHTTALNSNKETLLTHRTAWMCHDSPGWIPSDEFHGITLVEKKDNFKMLRVRDSIYIKFSKWKNCRNRTDWLLSGAGREQMWTGRGVQESPCAGAAPCLDCTSVNVWAAIWSYTILQAVTTGEAWVKAHSISALSLLTACVCTVISKQKV